MLDKATNTQFTISEYDFNRLRQLVSLSVRPEMRDYVLKLVSEESKLLSQDLEPIMESLEENQKALEEKLNSAVKNMAAPQAGAKLASVNLPTALQTRIEKVEHRVETLEILERDDVIIVDGLENKHKKPLDEEICDELNHHTDLTLHPSELMKCSFIGSLKNPPTLPRSIRVKLRRLQNQEGHLEA